MARSFRITDKKMYNIWGIFSEDTYVCKDNLTLVRKICAENGIDDDSVNIFEIGKFEWEDVAEIMDTPSFFGERLVIIETKDICEATDEEIERLTALCNSVTYNHLVLVFPYSDSKKIKAKKYTSLLNAIKNNGLFHFVDAIDEDYLRDMIIERADKNGTKLSKNVATKIIQNIGKDVGMLQNETDKYCSASGYKEITLDIVDKIGTKTVEASVFDMIELICSNKSAKAIEKLNNLFDMKTDEMAIIGALESSFIDIHRCKTASKKRFTYNQVNEDFDNRPNPYKYQKAMGYSQKFTLSNLELILELLMETDVKLKSSAINKKQTVYVVIAQIISKVNAR